MPRLKNMKKTKTSTEQDFLYRCLFAALFERNQGGNRRCCRFIGFSSNFDNVWFHTLLFLCAAKITKLWESFLTILNQPRQHWKIEMMLWGFAEECYEERKDWRICHVFQNCEESWIRRRPSIEKPRLFYLVKSRSSINYSNVFAKDRHSFAMWVYLPASAR